MIYRLEYSGPDHQDLMSELKMWLGLQRTGRSGRGPSSSSIVLQDKEWTKNRTGTRTSEDKDVNVLWMPESNIDGNLWALALNFTLGMKQSKWWKNCFVTKNGLTCTSRAAHFYFELHGTIIILWISTTTVVDGQKCGILSESLPLCL